MEEVNLIPEEKLLKIGKKEIDVSRIIARRSFKAAAMYNKKTKGIKNKNYDPEDKNSKEYFNYESEYDLILALLDCVHMLIRTDFKITEIREWFKRITITKRYIMNTIDGKDLMDFIEEALDPIIGAKKKELNRQNKAMDAMLILMDNLTPEQIAQAIMASVQLTPSLQSYARTQDTQKTTA